MSPDLREEEEEEGEEESLFRTKCEVLTLCLRWIPAPPLNMLTSSSFIACQQHASSSFNLL